MFSVLLSFIMIILKASSKIFFLFLCPEMIVLVNCWQDLGLVASSAYWLEVLANFPADLCLSSKTSGSDLLSCCLRGGHRRGKWLFCRWALSAASPLISPACDNSWNKLVPSSWINSVQSSADFWTESPLIVKAGTNGFFFILSSTCMC